MADELTTHFNDTNNTLTVNWKIVNFKSIKEKFIRSEKFSMPLFPSILWAMKFYPLAQNNMDDTRSSNQKKNIGAALCTNGNVFANYKFHNQSKDIRNNVISSPFIKVTQSNSYSTNGSSQYFSCANSDSPMFVSDYSNILSNDVEIMCAITIPYDSYVGGEMLRPFQHGLKVLENQNYSDFVIKVQEKHIYVHKCVLSTHWPHFVTLLESEMSETKSGMLRIEDENPDIIEAMIYYIYTGTSNVTDVNIALDLITASDKYNLLDLKAKSLKFVITKMNEQCVVKALFKAQLHDLNDLFEACINYLKNNSTPINVLPDYDLLMKSKDGFQLLALCLDNIRGVKRKFEEYNVEN
ncbi:unnamed protein product [Adineta ricciae]|uniref:BTB domain-containing protein n=1 Tax=Adineta ricciae TaxID=249248 RepID=A0A815KYF0_ADIRI|nr:unnamed protein product [Adineta ricciae]CAF1402006.1 unnamed protein product [Adineta ricciae]